MCSFGSVATGESMSSLAARFFPCYYGSCCLHSLLPPPRSTAITSRLRSSQILPKSILVPSAIVLANTIWFWPLPVKLLSYHGLCLIICLITSYSIWLHVYVGPYVSLFGHSAVVFHVLKCFVHAFMFYWLFFLFQWHFIDLLSCIAASLFNKLTYLLTRPINVLNAKSICASETCILVSLTITSRNNTGGIEGFLVFVCNCQNCCDFMLVYLACLFLLPFSVYDSQHSTASWKHWFLHVWLIFIKIER